MIKSIIYQKPDGTAVEVSLVKECPECGGLGVFEDGLPSLIGGLCPTCSGTGEVWNYITPKMWKDLTGEDVPGWMPVWYWNSYTEKWHTTIYRDLDFKSKREVVIFTHQQPAPNPDYIPEDDQ